jgi:RNA polymerase sigma-70 factor (ECF subfamily)
LVKAALRNEPEAWAELFTRHKPRVRQTIRQMVGNDTELVEDLQQEAFVQIFLKLSQWRPIGSLQSWILTVTRNKCKEHLRRQAVQPDPLEELDENLPNGNSPNPETVLLRKERTERIHEAIRRLPASLRSVAILRFEEELPYPEIQAALNLSAGQVGDRIHRATQILRRELAAYFQENGADLRSME